MANYDLTYEGSRVQGILDTGNSLKDAGYIFRGEATPSTVPGTPTERVAYIGGPGTYTNFGGSITVPVGRICVFKYTGSAWSNQVIDTKVSDGAAYKGIATPTTNPGSPIGTEFYIAVQAGTYTNFGSLAVTEGINILKYNGSAWSVDQAIAIDAEPTQGSDHLVKSGGVLGSIIQNGPAFDLSAYNAQGGVLATYADLSAALTALNTLPADFKKGGMSVKFVQTSDNKYVQYRLTSIAFATTESEWQKQGAEVSVSQNSQTGHTDINIGSDAYPVASAKEISKIDAQLNGISSETIDLVLDGSVFWKDGETEMGESILINVLPGDSLNLASNWRGNSLPVRYSWLKNTEDIVVDGRAYTSDDSHIPLYTSGEAITCPSDCVAIVIRTMYVNESIVFTTFNFNGVDCLNPITKQIGDNKVEIQPPLVGNTDAYAFSKGSNKYNFRDNKLNLQINGKQYTRYDVILEGSIFWVDGSDPSINSASIVLNTNEGDVLNLASTWKGNAMDVRYSWLTSTDDIVAGHRAYPYDESDVVKYTHGEDIVCPQGCVGIVIRISYVGTDIVFTQFQYNGVNIEDCLIKEIEGINQRIGNIEEQISSSLTEKTISILGDSISTFDGVAGSTQPFFPHDDNTDESVTQVAQCWWGQVISKTGASLCRLYAYGGRGMQDTLAQHCNLLHSNGAIGADPDVILIFGGHNDFSYAPITYLQRNPALGTINDNIPSLEADPATLTFDTFASAYMYTLAKMQKEYPKALIVCMTLKFDESGWFQKNVSDEYYYQYTDMIKSCADKYKVPVIDISTNLQETAFNYTDYCFDNIHPNLSGCTKIASVVVNTIKSLMPF